MAISADEENGMWRHGAGCEYWEQAPVWSREPEESREEIIRHLAEAHGIGGAREERDYHLRRERQCDCCLEPYLDHCTKCGRDFCQFHAGDIDGL